MYSSHYITDRVARENLIKQIGIGTAVATVRIDRGHPAGPELHTLTTTGIIVIHNEATGKLVTKLIARPNQIRKRFKVTPEIERIIQIAALHQSLNYNHV